MMDGSYGNSPNPFAGIGEQIARWELEKYKNPERERLKGKSIQEMNDQELNLAKELGVLSSAQVVNESMRRQGKNADGSYIKPEFQGLLGKDGKLQDQYRRADWQRVDGDWSALDNFKATANRAAGQLSPWASQMLEKQKLEQSMGMDQAARTGANAFNSAQSMLARSGGVSSGARERMAMNAARSASDARASAMRQGLLDRMNIQTQDEKDRMSQLGQLQTMENQRTDLNWRNQQSQNEVNNYNQGLLLKNLEARNNYDLDTWKQNMQSWAANKSADAQAQAARSGGGGKK